MESKLQRRLILRSLDEGFDKKAWHGPNLLGSIRRVPATLAARRPGRGRHSIADITVHCAYWKYAIRRRIRSEKRGSFALKGSNWFDLPSHLTDKQWRGYVAILREAHVALREAISSTMWATMVKAFGNESKFLEQAFGISMHDTYHAGQIQTLKAILKNPAASP